MILEVSGRAFPRRADGAPQVYVAHLAVAPDNRRSIRDPRKLEGCGSALLEGAVEESRSRGWSGRVALHSLPGAVGFYKAHDFEDLGPDPHDLGFRYFERSAEGVMRVSKELVERARRGLEMERRGLEPGVIGTKDRRLSMRARLARILEGLSTHYEKDGVRITIAGPLFSEAGHASLGVILEVTPRAMCSDASRRAIRALPDLVHETFFWEPEVIGNPERLKRRLRNLRAAAARKGKRARKA